MFRDRFDDEDEDEQERSELTLGIGSLLGIFFGLVLLCGLFFGFGYTLGHGKSPVQHTNPSAATPAKSSATSTTSQLNTSGAKPAAKQAVVPQAQTLNGTPANPGPQPTLAGQTGTQMGNQPGNQPGAQPRSPQTNAQQSATATPPAQQTANSGNGQQVFQNAVPRAPSQTNSSGQTYMVQVAALSRPSDAQLLVSALQKRGFDAVARTNSQDNLTHVQIGPFQTLAAANQVRARLISDGYNAILKP